MPCCRAAYPWGHRRCVGIALPAIRIVTMCKSERFVRPVPTGPTPSCATRRLACKHKAGAASSPTNPARRPRRAFMRAATPSPVQLPSSLPWAPEKKQPKQSTPTSISAERTRAAPGKAHRACRGLLLSKRPAAPRKGRRAALCSFYPFARRFAKRRAFFNHAAIFSSSRASLSLPPTRRVCRP